MLIEFANRRCFSASPMLKGIGHNGFTRFANLFFLSHGRGERRRGIQKTIYPFPRCLSLHPFSVGVIGGAESKKLKQDPVGSGSNWFGEGERIFTHVSQQNIFFNY